MSKEIKNIEEEIIIYQADDHSPQIDVHFNGELDKEATCRKFRQVRTEGSRQVERELPFFNLDVILAVGYRVQSRIATIFRKRATIRLHEDMKLLRGLGWCGNKTSSLPNFLNKTTSVAKKYNIYLQPHYRIKTPKI
jgi:hypothetical protein